jgi:hypothetical protein
MFKQISICVAFVMLGVVPLRAQQQEAVLQRVELPGMGIDVLVATAKSPAVTIDLGNSPDAMVIPLVGNALTLVFEDGAKMLAALDSLRYPGCSLFMPGKDGNPARAVSLYVAPKGDLRLSSGR